MQAYKVVPRDPVHLNYRGYDIFGMAPPSSGGTTDLEALNIMQHSPKPADKTQTLLPVPRGDPALLRRPQRLPRRPGVREQPDRGPAVGRLRGPAGSLIGPQAPAGPVAPARRRRRRTSGSAASVDRVGSTTHLSVADRWGNIVAYTFTIEQTGGNGIVVPGYGFLLNNELTDFDTASTTAPNRADGGKRPRSSIAPTIVTKKGKPFMTVGSPGGASIITTVLQILVNRIDLQMTLPDAVAAPRASQRNSATTEAESAFQSSPEGLALAQNYKEAYRLPAGNEIGAATGIEFTNPGRGHGDHGHGHHGHWASSRPPRRPRPRPRQAQQPRLPRGRRAHSPRRRRGGGRQDRSLNQSSSTGSRARALSTTASASASASTPNGPVPTATTRTPSARAHAMSRGVSPITTVRSRGHAGSAARERAIGTSAVRSSASEPNAPCPRAK